MRYGFIGCGNMGGAIARALSRKTKDILISDPTDRARELAEELGVQYTKSNHEMAEQCERIFIAVKPHMVEGVLAPLKEILQNRCPLIISMAAGLEIAKIEAFAGGDLPVIRIMPNTPTAIGFGMIQYCKNALVTDEALNSWLSDMEKCGALDSLEERLIDASSALSGSGPAYMYVFLEALADGAVACGIPRAKAMEYAAQTMLGSAEMFLKSGKHPGELKDAVCSPGGSTIAGLKALEEHAFRGAVMDCVMTAYNKNKELGK